jgi:hypothetical protein
MRSGLAFENLGQGTVVVGEEGAKNEVGICQ